jgi:hypothetical protein
MAIHPASLMVQAPAIMDTPPIPILHLVYNGRSAALDLKSPSTP